MAMNTFPIIEGAYFQDLMAQPDVLGAVTARLAATRLDPAPAAGLLSGKIRQVVLTGMGSSLHAAWPLHRALAHAGLNSHWVEAAELLHGFNALYREDTLLIAISQSGESAEVANLMQRAGEFGHVIGITNNQASSLGCAAATCLSMEAGPESTVSCKTYLNTLAVLRWLESALLRGDPQTVLEELRLAEQAARDYLADWRSHTAELMPLLEGISSVFVTGRGNSLATTGTGGLILKESTRRPAEGMSAAAFRHGPMEMAGDEVLVLILEGDATVAPLHHRLADDIIRSGGKAVLIGPRTTVPGVFHLPDIPEGVQPIMEILPVQMLSLALAAREGFEAGKFVRASKITNIS